MATRNLSQKYLALRAHRRSSSSTAPGSAASAGAATSVGLDSIALTVEPATTNAEEKQPQWVDIHETIVKDLVKVKENSQETEKDTIAHDSTTRLNVMRSLGTELAHISKHFRHIQKDFFRNLRDQEKIGEQFFSSDTGNAVSLEDALNNGLTENQVAELAQIEAQSNDREKEIIKIAQSVNELANLFKELNMLVIEQGTVLDRIDYNIETSCQKIKKGVVDLEAANEMSKKALSTKCLVILVIIVSLLLIVFIAKASS